MILKLIKMEGLDNLFTGIFRLVVAIPIGYFYYKEGWFQIFYGLIFMIFLDTVLGVWVAIKFKKFSSWKLSRVAEKTAKYFFALMTAYFVFYANDSFGWLVSSLGVFFVLTEAVSNFEKLSLLGLELPTSMLAKINDQFKDLKLAQNSRSKKREKKAVSEILKKC